MRSISPRTDHDRYLGPSRVLRSGERPTLLVLASAIGLVVGLPGRGFELGLLAALATGLVFVLGVALVDHLVGETTVGREVDRYD